MNGFLKKVSRLIERNKGSEKRTVNLTIPNLDIEGDWKNNLQSYFTPSDEIKDLYLNPKIRNLIRAAFSIRGIPTTFFGDSLITYGKNLSFLNESKFLREFTRALERYEVEQERSVLQGIIWRAYVFNWAAQSCLSVEGDFVEAGCHFGFRVDISSHYLDFNRADKIWFLYDTFQGIPEDQIDPGFSNPDTYLRSGSEQQVKMKFAEFNNVKVIKGRLPEVLDEVSPEKIAFLHIDLNSSIAERQTIRVLFNRISPGGIILLDDYGWTMFKKQKEVIDKDLISWGCPILELPTGQAIIIKREEENFFQNVGAGLSSTPKSWPDLIEPSCPIDADSTLKNEIEKAERYRKKQIEIINERLAYVDHIIDNVTPEEKNQLKRLKENWEAVTQRQDFHIYKRVGSQYFVRYVVDDFFDNLSYVREIIQQDTDELRRILDLQENLIRKYS